MQQFYFVVAKIIVKLETRELFSTESANSINKSHNGLPAIIGAEEIIFKKLKLALEKHQGFKVLSKFLIFGNCR